MDTDKINRETRQRIVSLLKESGISVNKLEKLTGISQRTLQNQINEDVKISMVTIRAIIELFKEVNPLWILFGSPHQKQLPVNIFQEAEKNKIRSFHVIAACDGDVAETLVQINTMTGLHENEKIILTRNNFYAPLIPAGCYVFLHQLSQWKKFIESGRIYYLELKTKGNYLPISKKGKRIIHSLLPLSIQKQTLCSYLSH